MKRLLRRAGFLLITALLTASVSISSSATIFLDVQQSDWFYPAAAFAVEAGLLTGTSEHFFSPDATVTRAMFYTTLSRAVGAATDNAIATNLADVPSGQWFTGPVVWSLSTGIATTVADGVFGVYEPISRAEICLALARFDAFSEAGALPTDALPVFPDLGELDEESVLAIAACQEAGVVAGGPDGRFDPFGSATRAEMSEILLNYFSLPETPLLAQGGEALIPWDTTAGGWTGKVELDFPLGETDDITADMVNWLNQRILTENAPASVAAYGKSIDGNARHLTNYGAEGIFDCCDVTTILENRKNNVAAGTPLAGRQEYYGYSLQARGVLQQDVWHQAAEDSGKESWQCTWWAWGRAAQYLETAYQLDFLELCGGKDALGHGKDYYRSLQPYFLSDQTPAANSIISWTAGTYGHVAYVEAVDAGGIWVSSADSGHTWRGITYIARSLNASNPYPLHWYSSERLNGFNHLDFAADGSPIG